MDCHLVPVEIRVESGTYQGVQPDGLPFDQSRLECLYPQTVQGGCPVQQHRMPLEHILENVPDHGFLLIDNLFGGLHRFHDPALDELADHEWFVQLGGHILGQAAFVQLHFRADHDHGTGRIIDPFPEQVLAETTLLPFQGVREGFQRPVGFRLHCGGLPGVVEEGVDCLLQHPLLVPEDHLGSLDLHKPLEAVVPDDHAAVQIVQVGSGETPPVKGYQRPEFRRDHRDDLHDHPFRVVFAVVLGFPQRFHYLQPLQGFCLPLFGSLGIGLVAKLVGELLQVDAGEQVDQALGPHLGDEFIRIAVFQVLVFRRDRLQDIQVFLLGEEVHRLDLLPVGALGDTRLDDHVTLVVDDHVQLLGRQAEQVAYLVGKRTEIPDMCHGDHQVDMPHAVAPDFLLGDLHPAPVTDDAAVPDTLVFTAGALVILYRAEDALAEEPVPFRLVRTVIDRFGLQDFPPRFCEDGFR